MSLDTWRRHRDGTLRHDGSTLSITRLQENRRSAISWRIDGFRNVRVPEYPDDTREGWKRVEFTLGTYATLREAKNAGEMHVRTRDGGGPRGTLDDWRKLRDELAECFRTLDSEVSSGFWDDVLTCRWPWLEPDDDTILDRWVELEQEMRMLAQGLLDIADVVQKRYSREARLAKLDALAAHPATPAPEAAAARKAAGRLRGNGPA